MKIQFEANQQVQLDAVAAVTDLFDGQPLGPPEFAVIKPGSDTSRRSAYRSTSRCAGRTSDGVGCQE